MKTFAQFGDSTQFALSRAILIYEGDVPGGGKTMIATMHNVLLNDTGAPEIQPGECVKQEAVQDLALTLLEQSGKLELLPPVLLALGIKGMIWHCPPARRQLWFSPRDKDKHPALKKISGEWFPQPHLLFQVRPGGLNVFALRGPAKPTVKSKLYQAPYWNVYSERGTLCIGSARIPKSPTPAHIPACEKGFFESNFTHSNCHDGRMTTHKGGHDGLWASLKGKRTFPEDTLVPVKDGKKNLTLGDLL